MEFLEVFKWICLAIFVCAAIVWLLDLAGLREMTDPGQRKTLNFALGTTLIGGMASFAATAFFDPGKGNGSVEPGPQQTETPAPPVGPTSQPEPTDAPTDAGTPTPPSTPSPSPSQTLAPGTNPMSAPACGVRVPQALAAWAQEELGDPPDFTCAERQIYPTCLDPLRQRSQSEISRAAARECGEELARFRRDYIARVYGEKAGYQVNLDNAEASLRFRTDEEAVERYDYVAAEISRMNGREWERFVEIDRRSRQDMMACQGQRRCLVD